MGFIGTLALAAALGGVLVGELVVVPGLVNQTTLVDANLATALTGPLHLRLGEIALAATLVLAFVVPRWLGSKRASGAALLAFGLAAAHRFVLLPGVYAAWSRVDRLAGRPVERFLEAQRLTTQAHWSAIALVLVLVAIAWLSTRTRRAPAPAAEPVPGRGEPTTEQALTATC
jgi:hypothetical protein